MDEQKRTRPEGRPTFGVYDPQRAEQLLSELFVMPEQMAPGRRYTPEQSLLLAVLLDAIYQWQRAKLDSATRRREQVWLEDSDPGRPFSFDYVCAALGLDVETSRAHILTRAVTTHPLSRQLRLVNRGMRMALNRRRAQLITPGLAWDHAAYREE